LTISEPLLSDILDALDLSRAQPGVGFLEALFTRFNARVPFESATKILRNAEVGDPSEKPRTPEVFWADHLERGAGGTCFARVAAFDALLSALGFATRRVLGRVERDGDHAALLVSSAGGETIADVGFPLPALLPARPSSVETPLAELRVDATGRGLCVRLLGGVPEGPRSIEIFEAPVSEETYLALWRGTFQPRSRFLEEVVLRHDLGSRVVSFASGEIRVDDLHSRLRVPLIGSRPSALSELFGVEMELLERAFEIVGDPPPESKDATLSAYLETEASPAEAFAAIASREGYERLLRGVADIVAREETPTGFRLALSASADTSETSVEEDVAIDSEALRLAIVRKSGASAFRSSYRAQERAGRTFLIREAVLSGAREDLLRNDSLRGRLAGTLAVDLLAWGRMLGTS
jgi:hypothetical protein